MVETNKVVAHLLDGKLVKGTTQDFLPNRPVFHVQQDMVGATSEVYVRDLKALFFVRDLMGNSNRKDVRGFPYAPTAHAQGKKIAVRFKDGELLCGYSMSYSPERGSFFLLPADSGSNNLRIYVVMRSIDEIGVGPAADALAIQNIEQPTE